MVIGGKADGLLRIRGAGLEVPAFIVIPPGDPIPTGVAAVISAGIPGPWAVRSSAAGEDAAAASWAGMFETVLGVDADGLPAAIERCRASGGSERVATYAAAHRADAGAIAVIVQTMITGHASGVLFSRDPSDPDRTLISVGLGLGEGVVQGRVPCDEFRIDEQGRIDAQIADKDEAVRLGERGPEVCPVDDSLRRVPAVSDAVLLELARGGRLLEERLGRPVDVEFTVVGDRVIWLQARPIAVPIPRGRRLLWDNSNIVESYSGITTPLTFSFASRAYTIVYQLFCRVMGVDEATIRANEPVFRRMIGFVRGRIYYNLDAWYRVLSLLPGFSFNRAAMETMMGVSEVAPPGQIDARGLGRLAEGLKLGRLSLRLAWRVLMVDRDARAFQAHVHAVLARVNAVDLRTLRLDELLELYEHVERELLWSWTPPLVNDFFCMIAYKLLESRCKAITADPQTSLHNELLAAEGALASAAPAEELVALAARIGADPTLRAVFTSDLTDGAVLERAKRDPWLVGKLDAWFAAYGQRSPDELKLECPTLRDTPEFVIATLRGFVKSPPKTDPGRKDDRAKAEERAWSLVRGPFARLMFGRILNQARTRVATREALRFERTRIFGFVRDLFRSFGARLHERSALADPHDVFFLTVDEILGYVRGTSPTVDLRGMVTLRKAEHAGFVAAEPPGERFFTWGAVHVDNTFRGKARKAVPTGDVVVGTACSPGVVTAPGRVVVDPRLTPDLGGGVLIAHRTDPGWIPLYPSCCAIVVERGSLLSHSAVVARELGIPAVVGCAGVVQWAKDGEIVTVDGTKGTVTREPRIVGAGVPPALPEPVQPRDVPPGRRDRRDDPQ